MRRYFSVRGVRVEPLEVDVSAHRRSGTTVGSKTDEAMVNPYCREIDKRKQAVDLKVTGEVSSSGRMASVGRNVAECRVQVKKENSVFDSWYFGR